MERHQLVRGEETMGYLCWGKSRSFLSGCATWPDGILLACRPVTGHLACGPEIFGSLCIAESPHPPNSLLCFSLSLSLIGQLPKDNCSALCGLAGLFILASWPWLVGRECHDSYRQPYNYATQSVTARWLFARHEAPSSVTYQGIGVIQL